MKYLIEVPDETGQAYYNIAPYTEPNQKAIDLQHAHDIENVARMNYSKGAEDAWEFAKRIICPSDCCDDSISRHTKEIFGKEGWETRGIFVEMTYQEAKKKYEAWKKSKEEIRIGDEIRIKTSYSADAVVIGMDDYDLYIVWKSGETDRIEPPQRKEWVKTGRHFKEVEELLKKITGESNEN